VYVKRKTSSCTDYRHRARIEKRALEEGIELLKAETMKREKPSGILFSMLVIREIMWPLGGRSKVTNQAIKSPLGSLSKVLKMHCQTI